MSSLKAATIAVVALLASGAGTVEAAPQVRAVVDLAEALEQRAANTNFAALEAFGQEALKRHDREGLNRLYHVAWTVLNQGDFFQYFLNSLTVTAASLFFVLLFGAMAAFALSEYRFRGNTLMGLYLALGIMIPIRLGTVAILQIMVASGLESWRPTPAMQPV